MSVLCVSMLVAVSIASQHQPAIKDNAGILSGPGYAFTLAAPSGWIFDTTSGRRENLPVVFYRSGESWSRAKVVMYANVVSLAKGKTVKDVVAADVARFRRRHANVKVESKSDIVLSNGRKLVLRIFRGTKHDETEYVAYANEEGSVVILVLSGEPLLVESAYGSFLKLLNSYNFITNEVHSSVPPNYRLKLTARLPKYISARSLT